MSAPGASTSDSPRKIKRININTSLSTLSPVHYEAMNTTTTIPALPGAPGGRALTASDVIRWQEEQAECLGELGFTTNFPDPADIFNPFTINPDFEDELPIDDHSVLVAANQEFRKAIMQVQQRKIIMDGAGAVVAKAEQITDQKLLAAGVPKQDFQDKILRHKIVKLANIEHPPPKANFVEVSVHVDLAIEGQSHILEINLPLEACIAEVYALLGEVVKALLSEKGFLYEGGGKWKYQLVDQDHFRVLQDRSSPLETDLDYILMVQQVSKVGEGKACVAVLTQGGLAKPIDMSEVQDGSETKGDGISGALSDDDYDEPLDEDGKPYFEPVMYIDRMMPKYADMGDDLTEENGIHGFWR